DLGGVIPVFGGGNGGSDRFDVLELRAAEELRGGTEVPDTLAEPEPLDLERAVERSFTLDGTRINQQPMDMGRIDEVVELGATEIWTVRNNMAFPHNFHVHD